VVGQDLCRLEVFYIDKQWLPCRLCNQWSVTSQQLLAIASNVCGTSLTKRSLVDDEKWNYSFGSKLHLALPLGSWVGQRGNIESCSLSCTDITVQYNAI